MIDLTAAIFQIPAFDAALKLARDFHVRVDREFPPGKEESPPLPKGLMADREMREQLWTALRVLCEYQRLLWHWKEQYAPKTPEEPPDDRFVEACQMYERIDDLTEGLTVGTEEQRSRVLALVIADNKITLLAERLERLRKEENTHGAEKETA